MDVEIIQKQDRKLLIEHANSSFYFTWIGKYEWLMATIFLILGILIFLFTETIRLSGLISIAIGILELIKYPNRVNRWVDKKTREKIFDKEIKFVLKDTLLEVSYADINKDFSYNDMRQCLISKTGILFKVSYTEYYYISFSSLENNTMIKEITEFLKSRFDNKRIKIRIE